MLRNLSLSLAAGLLLWLSNPLAPAWWAAWLVPLPLLWLAFSNEVRRAQLWVALAVACGTSAFLPYFHLVMPWPAAIAAWLGQSLLWWWATMATRRIVLARPSAWAILAWPMLWAGMDTLLAALLPDGNWGSFAYTQADLLPLAQVASLAGVAGLLFLLCLPASAIAVLAWHGRRQRGRGVAMGAVVVLLAAAVGFGEWRMRQTLEGVPMRVGLASIDDAIGTRAAPGYASRIRDRYGALVAQLAESGARLVVLPEKIAVLVPTRVDEWQTYFGRLAARHRVWLEVGIAVDDGRAPRNHAWLFDPAGQLVEDYEKQRLAPPERAEHYAGGDAFRLHAIDGSRYGLAICKDMHFADFGRDYAALDAGAMLVPAWDFGYVDGWLGARMTALRGVESGYAVIRAAREGLLTVSDAHGRILAQTNSVPMPGATLVADLKVGERIATPYARIGDAFGWLCVALATWLLLMAQRRSTAP